MGLVPLRVVSERGGGRRCQRRRRSEAVSHFSTEENKQSARSARSPPELARKLNIRVDIRTKAVIFTPLEPPTPCCWSCPRCRSCRGRLCLRRQPNSDAPLRRSAQVRGGGGGGGLGAITGKSGCCHVMSVWGLGGCVTAARMAGGWNGGR